MVGVSVGGIAGGLVVGIPRVSGPMEPRTEELLEGTLSIIVAIFITLSGPHILRSGRDARREANPNNPEAGVVDRVRVAFVPYAKSFVKGFVKYLKRPEGQGLGDAFGRWLERIVSSRLFWITAFMLCRELLEGVIFTWAIAIDLPLGDRLAGGFTGAGAGILLGIILYM